MRSSFLAPLLAVATSGWAAAGDIQFFDTPGKWKIPGKKNFVHVMWAPDGFSFKIRDAGSVDRDLPKYGDWFIAMEDNNHFWVYYGHGKLQYFVWQEEPDNSLQVTEKLYPNMGNLTLPPEVEERVKKEMR